MTDSFGTVASETALIILAPWRMIPWRSTCVPIMKPGTSARNSSGRLNALHVQMKRAALSALSTNSTPPFCLGWLATMPIARPSMRAKPTMISLAQRGWTSKNDSSSTIPAMSSFMSNGLFSSRGICGNGAPGSAGGARGGSLGPVRRHVGQPPLGGVDALLVALHQQRPAPRHAGVHARAAHLLERHLLAD